MVLSCFLSNYIPLLILSSVADFAMTISKKTFKKLVDDSIELIKARKTIEKLEHKLSNFMTDNHAQKIRESMNSTSEYNVSLILNIYFDLYELIEKLN